MFYHIVNCNLSPLVTTSQYLTFPLTYMLNAPLHWQPQSILYLQIKLNYNLYLFRQAISLPFQEGYKLYLFLTSYKQKLFRPATNLFRRAVVQHMYQPDQTFEDELFDFHHLLISECTP